MDTYELSIEAHSGILEEAEKLSHDLTLQYGLLSYECVNEDDYLNESEKLTKILLKARSHDLEEIFYSNPPSIKDLKNTLNTILNNIIKVREIPIERRNFNN